MRRRQSWILAAAVALAILASIFSTFALPRLSDNFRDLLIFFFAALVAFYTVAQGVVAVDDFFRRRREPSSGREYETREDRREGREVRRPALLAPPFTLPPDLHTFTGREDLLEQLDDLLHPGKETAVAIVGMQGMAGVGKSVLAIHAAYLWQDRFPEGLIWVDLRGENAAYDALRRIAGLYGYRENAAEIGDNLPELADLVRTILRDRRALLILDNAERLSADELACLLPGVPGPVTVVTSRRAFPGLARLGRTLRVDVMDPDEALDLFSRLLGKEKVEADEEAHRDLAKRLGHLPLALDIAARLMRRKGWGATEMLRRLERAADLPAFLALPVPERPEDSVAFAFALSYDDLDDADQELFRALSPFAPTGFTPVAVANVLGQAGQGEDEVEIEIEKTVEAFVAELERVEASLERLVDLSLVRHAAPPTTCDLHPLLRDYARALAQRAGESARWAERHANYYLALATHQRPRLGGPDYQEALSEMDTAYPNVRVAWEAMVTSEHWELARDFVYAVADYQDRRGMWREMQTWAQAGLMACERLDDLEGRAGMQVILGNAYLGLTTGDRAENLEGAMAAYQAALEVLTREDLPIQWATTQNNLGNAFCERIRGDRADNLEGAIAAYTHVLEIHPENGWVFLRRANVYSDLKRYDDALDDLQTADRLQPDNPWILNSLGSVYTALEQHDRALEAYTAAIAHAADDEDKAMYHRNRVGAQIELGRLEEARHDCEQALALDPENPYTQERFGDLYLALEEHEKAVDSYQRAIEGEPSTARYFGLGRALLALGRRDEAREAYQAGREMASPDEIEAALEALQGVDEEAVSWLCD